MLFRGPIKVRYFSVTETLRLYPPVPTLMRECDAKYRIPDTEYFIERGAKIIIPVFAMHRDPKYFPDPDKYDPENFNEDRVKERDHFTYLPFGEGPRICIGNKHICKIRRWTKSFKIGQIVSEIGNGKIRLSTHCHKILLVLFHMYRCVIEHKSIIVGNWSFVSGLRFGLMQVKMGLTTLLSKFNISVTDQTPIPVQFNTRKITTNPVSDIHLRISLRNL